MNASSFVLLAVRLLQPYCARKSRLLPSVERASSPTPFFPLRRGLLTHWSGSGADLAEFTGQRDPGQDSRQN
jgi:hypothetical protein